MSNRASRKHLLASTIIAGAILASAAGAQVTVQPGTAPAPAVDAGVVTSAAGPQEPTSTGEIVVTGSLIRNPNLISASPVNTVGEGELTLRAPNTPEEALRALPGVVPGLGTQVNNGANGTNTLNLRGLGQQRNLVLLDGNRLVPATSDGATDLNIIPLALIQRVDVLTGGASTTYGADAVAGVANFITRRDFTGIDLRANYKIPQRGEGASYRADLTLGANFADDRGNAVLSLGYNKIDPIYQTRPFALFGISSTNGRASGASFTSTPTTIAFDSTNLQVNPAGTALVPQYQGFNFNPYNIFQTPLDRKSLYAAARYDVTDDVEVYGRGMFVQTTIQQIIAPSGIFGLSETVNFNNPYLNDTIRSQICAQTGVAAGSCNATATPQLSLPGVYRRTVELGPRLSTWESNVYDARAGVRWNIRPSLTLDVAGSYGRSEIMQTQSGYALNSRVTQALQATSTTTCVDTSNNCVPLNIFGPAGSISAAQAGFISGQSTTRITTELKQAHVVLTGDVGYTLPTSSKPISFAVGGEYRQYTYVRAPDAFAQNPSELGGAGGAVLPFAGGYNVKEAFGELAVPVVSDKPLLKEVQLNGGIRYSSYGIDAAGSPGFNTTTYKGEAIWEVFDGFRFRGNYQRAVRAPNIGELFAPTVTGLTNLTVDPCVGVTNANANLAAVCRAQGAPASAITAGSIQNPSAGQANATGGGNASIRPEKADTITAGIVLTPRQFIPGFSLSVDYFNIRIKGAITSATPGDVLAACFGNITAASATSAACTSIRRNPVNGYLSGPSATTFGLPTPLTNAGRIKTDGIDVTANYKRTIGLFNLDLNFSGNYTRQLRFAASSSSFSRNCVGYYSANCGASFSFGQLQPKYSFQQRTTLGFGGANLSLLWRHLSSMNYEGTASDYLARGFTTGNRYLFNGVISNASGINSAYAGRSVNMNHIKAYNYFDLSTQFDVTKTLQLTFTIQNLLDKDPPIVGGQAGTTTANGGNTFPSTYDTIGRVFSMTARIKL